jgi:hypothetical protein
MRHPQAAGGCRIDVHINPYRLIAGRQQRHGILAAEERFLHVDAGFTPAGDKHDQHGAMADERGGLGLGQIGMPGNGGR